MIRNAVKGAAPVDGTRSRLTEYQARAMMAWLTSAAELYAAQGDARKERKSLDRAAAYRAELEQLKGANTHGEA